MDNRNPLRWDGSPGHYEVYYLTFTDPQTRIGFWIRYTMLAPVAGKGEATASLWFCAMDPAGGVIGRKETFPVAALACDAEPFKLTLGDATLSDEGMAGGFGDVSWDLSWSPATRGHDHVHPLLEKAKIAKTVLTLPHGDVVVSGTVRYDGRELSIADARGGQAHLWGSKHALRWAWVHCNDLAYEADGSPAPGEFVDGVSVFVPRFGREVGPSTPFVGRIDGEDFASVSPLRVLRNPSTFSLTGWEFEARTARTKVRGAVSARREELVGVTYTDPDGEHAYCYNSEIADIRLQVFERMRNPPPDLPTADGWTLTRTLVGNGTAHFEYAQREPVPGLELHLK